ncbi:hypothetical protein EJB05_33996, partial [Eragrostis curvula]
RTSSLSEQGVAAPEQSRAEWAAARGGRVNALENVVKLRLENTIAYIKGELDEQEREEFFRLKKIQGYKQRELEHQMESAQRYAEEKVAGEVALKRGFELLVCVSLPVVYFEMEYHHCVKAFEAYVGAAKQVDELLAFYAWSSDFPEINRIDEKLLKTLEQFMRECGRAADAGSRRRQRTRAAAPSRRAADGWAGAVAAAGVVAVGRRRWKILFYTDKWVPSENRVFGSQPLELKQIFRPLFFHAGL